MARLRIMLVQLCAGWLLAFPGLGWAQSAHVGVELYRPTSPAERGFALEGAQVLPRWGYAVALDGNYALDPLKVTATPGGTFDVLKHQAGADLLLALGLGHRLELALALPVTLSEGGSAPPGLAGPPAAGLGDLRLAAKVLLHDHDARGFSLAAALVLSTPFGQDKQYLNERGVTFEPRLIGEWQRRRWSAGARLGYRARSQSDVLGTSLDDELTWAWGGQVRIGHSVRLIGEFDGATGVGSFFKRTQTPLETLWGARKQIGLLSVGAGAGLGLLPGYGAPALRLLGTVGWASVAPDSDHDGIPDTVDRCPDDPEDKDDFEDADGCPDPDNDKDGIADAQDKCPNQPEDKDDFEDDDGCPDPDNDKDGIADDDDDCPDEPETMNDFEDDDGCPDEAPDTDTDGDGIKDVKDKCPTEPEDKDGFEDDDGCPDPDNDKDGVPDASDKCPNEPETINGNKDDDGCPDEGAPQVHIGDKELETLKPVFFDLDRSRIRHHFWNLLEQIALTLKAHPEIGRCAVEGHTDDTGPSRWNQELSVSRAKTVVAFLVKHGVAPDRLTPIGQGQAMPWAENSTEEGRAQNRRVVFHIEGQPPMAKPTKLPLLHRSAGGGEMRNPQGRAHHTNRGAHGEANPAATGDTPENTTEPGDVGAAGNNAVKPAVKPTSEPGHDEPIPFPEPIPPVRLRKSTGKPAEESLEGKSLKELVKVPDSDGDRFHD